jgi:hypothetical protein
MTGLSVVFGQALRTELSILSFFFASIEGFQPGSSAYHSSGEANSMVNNQYPSERKMQERSVCCAAHR